MPEGSKSKLKPLYLMDIFREMTDSSRRMSVPELVEELERRGVRAERKGLYRDIDALIEYGADIRKSSTGYYMGSRLFTPAELKVLTGAVQAAGFISESRTRELTGKIASLAGAAQAKQLRCCTMGGVKSANDEVLNMIAAIDGAITGRKQITFAYHKLDASLKEVAQRGGGRYRVSPYAMIWMQDRYYLVANMEGRDDLTHFRIDRMRFIRPDAAPWRHFCEVSEYRVEFNASDYAAKCLNMFGGEPERIQLSCHPSMMDELTDRFGRELAVRRRGTDRLTVTVLCAAGQGFAAWAAQFGDRVEVLAPAGLRRRMREHLAGALGQYAEQPPGTAAQHRHDTI